MKRRMGRADMGRFLPLALAMILVACTGEAEPTTTTAPATTTPPPPNPPRAATNPH